MKKIIYSVALVLAMTQLNSQNELISIWGNWSPPEPNPNNPEFWKVQSSACIPQASPWVLGGNNLVVPGPAAITDIGTCSDHPFILKANGLRSVWITQSGKIGIGTPAPKEQLHMENAGDAVFRIESTGNSGQGWDFISSAGQGQLISGHFGIMDVPNNAVRFNIDNAGNVGIGSLSPLAKLEVRDAANTNIYSFSTNNNGNAGLWALNGTSNFGLRIDGSTGIGRITENVVSPLDLISFKYNTTFSKPQAWVGQRPITGAHADFNFAAPKIVSQDIYVFSTGNWADYVFDETYKLPKLYEVEEFYKANHHLPEIPSAKEVQENGINVGEMNTLLLKKVEELTIYLVEQNKRIEELESRNKDLKCEMSKLLNTK